MSQIMALAQSLSGPEPVESADEGEELPAAVESERRDRDVELLSALRPYLRQSRRSKLDRALELLQLLRLLKGNRE